MEKSSISTKRPGFGISSFEPSGSATMLLF
jgi:hypothetical protein